jgi:ligand-binding sensor domain-containing protein/anti-sigma regulatory factor (Ser/Thr protein kinase)
MRQYIFALVLIFSSIAAYGQRYTFQVYSNAQGLPQSQVTAITQDEKGYLWVGTLDGLAKFNGKDFETFTTDNGLFNNRITFLTFVKGELWIGHEGGISHLTSRGFEKYAMDPKDRKIKVSDIELFNNKIVVGSNGAGLYQLLDGKLQSVKLNEPDHMRIRDLSIVKDELWIATRGGLLAAKELNVIRTIPETEVLNISSLVLREDKMYLSTYNDGFIELTMTTNHLKKINDDESTLSLRFAYLDNDEHIWLNTMNGMQRHSKDGRLLTLSESNGLPMDGIMTMFQDRDGNIWFGSEGKGLIRFTGEQFVYYDQRSGFSSDLILNVNADRSGNFWFGTYDKGIVKMTPSGVISKFEFENNTVWTSLIDVDGFNWFGTGFGLVAMKNGKVVKTHFYADGTPGDKITALQKINNSSFLVGGSEGVALYENGKFRRISSSETETVRDFCKLKGKIYCATDKGLFVLDGEKLKRIGKIGNTVYSLTKDKQDRLWIGTEMGLFIMENGEIESFPISKNQTANLINFVEYHEEMIYIGTNNGLYVVHIDNDKKTVITKFGISDGLVDLETNINSGFIDRKGRLWFGTASGLVCYRPKFQKSSNTQPSIVLKRILLNFSEEEVAKYTLDFDASGFPKSLRMPFSRNNVSFELDGISLSDHPGLRFQYKLDGLETGWSPLNTSTTVAFSSLPAGKYVFQARCTDSRGHFSEVIDIAFEIKPAFYKTWWFILLMGLLGALIVILIFQFRVKRLREQNENEKLEFKSRLLTLEQRSLNASMNRHFIFNSLNSIQYFINTQDRLSANRFLTNFAKLIRKNLDSSEEGNVVTLEQELERLNLYLSLESMRFKDRFEYKITCEEGIDQETVAIPAMILQPFVENSIIHGILPNEEVKGMIDVQIRKNGEILEIIIRDNGIGIENSRQSKSHIEGDHKSQGMDITTKRIELLNRLSDKHFEIIGPRQLENPDRSINGTEVILKITIQNLED